MRTSNPALNDSTFDTYALAGEEKMTIQGTVNKSFILIALVFSTALLSWDFMSNLEGGIIYVVAAAIIALILGLATSFKPTWSPYTAPAYALFDFASYANLTTLIQLILKQHQALHLKPGRKFCLGDLLKQIQK